MTYAEVLGIVEERADSVTAFVPVVNEDGECGLFWGCFALSYRGEDMTERMAADIPPRTRGMASLVAVARARREALERGMELMA